MHEANNVPTVPNLSFEDLPEKSYPVTWLESKPTNWVSKTLDGNLPNNWINMALTKNHV